MAKNKWLIMTADNSPSRSLVKANAADAVPAALGPELEEAAGRRGKSWFQAVDDRAAACGDPLRS
jgi:hypothetical protein